MWSSGVPDNVMLDVEAKMRCNTSGLLEAELRRLREWVELARVQSVRVEMSGEVFWLVPAWFKEEEDETLEEEVAELRRTSRMNEEGVTEQDIADTTPMSINEAQSQ